MSATSTEARTSPTPLLDRLAPLPELRSASPGARTRLAVALAVSVLGFAAFFALDPLAEDSVRRRILEVHAELFPEGWTTSRAILAAFSFLASLVLAIVVHETGHLLAGLCAGFRFSQLRAGPLQIDRPFRVSLRRSQGIGYAGWVSMFPARRDRLLLRAAVLVLGGPLINLACAAALLLLPIAKGFFLWSFVLVSLALGVRELLPIRRRIAVADGRRLWLMLRDPPWNRRWLALMRLGAELRNGTLPEAFSPEYLAEAIAHRDENPDTVTAHALAHATAFHQHRDDDAARFLETSLEFAAWATPPQREALISDAGLFQARRRKRADLAEQWLAAMPEPPRSRWLRTRLQAGILEARGDLGGALLKLEELEQDLRELPDRAVGRVFLRLLERWRSELRSQMASRAPSGACAD